ncbi:hypothetical protein TNCV_1860171 [Trichonephila clavipes]|nr:hypothetical protein TNCV_1860171 [Trichonephila clavipes]
MDDTTQNEEATTPRNGAGYMIKDTEQRASEFQKSRYLYPMGNHMIFGWMDVVQNTLTISIEKGREVMKEKMEADEDLKILARIRSKERKQLTVA